MAELDFVVGHLPLRPRPLLSHEELFNAQKQELIAVIEEARQEHESACDRLTEETEKLDVSKLDQKKYVEQHQFVTYLEGVKREAERNFLIQQKRLEDFLNREEWRIADEQDARELAELSIRVSKLDADEIAKKKEVDLHNIELIRIRQARPQLLRAYALKKEEIEMKKKTRKQVAI